MVELLEDAFLKAESLPVALQEELAHVLFAFLGHEDVLQLTPEEDADLAEAEAEISRGEIATAEEAAAVFSRFRRRRLATASEH